MGSIIETGEEIVKSVKSIAAEPQHIQNPGATHCIDFVSDSGGPYWKAWYLLKEEGVSEQQYFIFCMHVNHSIMYVA